VHGSDVAGRACIAAPAVVRFWLVSGLGEEMGGATMTSAANRFCQTCGNPLGELSQFCDRCGTPVGTAMAAPVPTVTPGIAGSPPSSFSGVPLPPPPASGPYPGAPVYGQPPVAPSVNGLAITSLVLGIVWIFGIGSILAVIFGFVGKSQIRRSGGRQNGGGLAIAGIVLGFIGVAGLILWIVLFAILASTVDNCLNQAQANPNANTVCGVTNTGSTGTGSTGTGGIFAPGTTGNSAAPVRHRGGSHTAAANRATSPGRNVTLLLR
jgi:hypothetical protein